MSIMKMYENISIHPRMKRTRPTSLILELPDEHLSEAEMARKSTSDTSKRRLAHKPRFPSPVVTKPVILMNDPEKMDIIYENSCDRDEKNNINSSAIDIVMLILMMENLHISSVKAPNYVPNKHIMMDWTETEPVAGDCYWPGSMKRRQPDVWFGTCTPNKMYRRNICTWKNIDEKKAVSLDAQEWTQKHGVFANQNLKKRKLSVLDGFDEKPFKKQKRINFFF